MLRDADGRRGRDRRPAPPARSTVAGRPPLGARRRLPLRPRGRSSSTTRATSSTATTSPSASAPSRCDGTEFLINGEPFYFTGFGKHEDHAVRRQGPRRRATWCTTSSCWTGSAPTRSAPRTTRTPRRSSTTPTGTASSSSTRPPPSGLNMGLGGGIFGGAGLHDLLARDDQRRAPARCTPRRSASSSPATRTTRASCCGRIANEPESDTEGAERLLRAAVRR